MPVCPLPLRIWLCTPYHMRIEACECRFMNIMSCRPTCEPAGAAPKASGQPRQTVKVVVADRKGSRDQAECAAMDPLHPPSTSMVEGEHVSTNIHRLIVIDGSSTVISEVRLKVTGGVR